MNDLRSTARRLARSSHIQRDLSSVQEQLMSHDGHREVQLAQEGMVRSQVFWVPSLGVGIFRDIECNFSFGFTHRPHFTCAYVLAPGQPTSDRYPPSATGSVINWRIPDGADDDVATKTGTQWNMHYGAKVNVIVTGPPLPSHDVCKTPAYQVGMIQITFTGQTIVYPLGGVEDESMFTDVAEIEPEP